MPTLPIRVVAAPMNSVLLHLLILWAVVAG